VQQALVFPFRNPPTSANRLARRYWHSGTSPVIGAPGTSFATTTKWTMCRTRECGLGGLGDKLLRLRPSCRVLWSASANWLATASPLALQSRHGRRMTPLLSPCILPFNHLPSDGVTGTVAGGLHLLIESRHAAAGKVQSERARGR
jgi:hypothetical protein